MIRKIFHRIYLTNSHRLYLTRFDKREYTYNLIIQSNRRDRNSGTVNRKGGKCDAQSISNARAGNVDIHNSAEAEITATAGLFIVRVA